MIKHCCVKEIIKDLFEHDAYSNENKINLRKKVICRLV